MVYLFRIIFAMSTLSGLCALASAGDRRMLLVWAAILAVSYAFSLRKVNQYFFSKKWFKLTFAVGVAFFVIVETAIVVNGGYFEDDKEYDYIIILGAQVRGDSPSRSLQNRIDKGYEYLIEHPKTKAILSGGQGPDERMSEAEAMKKSLLQKGIDQKRLILEEHSSNTKQNLKYSYELIEGNSECRVAIVTNRFHVLRAKLIARDMGKNVGGIGAKCYPYLIPNDYLREFFAVVKEIII